MVCVRLRKVLENMKALTTKHNMRLKGTAKDGPTSGRPNGCISGLQCRVNDFDNCNGQQDTCVVARLRLIGVTQLGNVVLVNVTQGPQAVNLLKDHAGDLSMQMVRDTEGLEMHLRASEVILPYSHPASAVCCAAFTVRAWDGRWVEERVDEGRDDWA